MAMLKKLILLALATSIFESIGMDIEEGKIEKLRQITILRAKLDELNKKIETELDLTARYSVRVNKRAVESEIAALEKIIYPAQEETNSE